MNIDRLDLIAYGHLTDVSLDLSATPHRFHMIVGSNESGKSTSMRAINAWLYGFTTQTADDYLHPMRHLRVGGVLRDGDQTLACVRRKGIRNTLMDASDGKTPLSEDRLMSMLGGVDRSMFTTQFLIDHSELVSGGQLILQGRGELGETLFAAGAGLGRLKKIQDQLLSDQEALFRVRGSCRIGDSLKAVKDLRSQLREAQAPPAEYASLQQRLSDHRAELDQLKQQNGTLSQRCALLISQIEAIPVIAKWQQATNEFSGLVDAPILPEDFADRRRELAASVVVAETTIGRLEKSKANLEERRDSIADDVAVLKHRGEVERLFRELSMREKAESDRVGHMAKVLSSQQRDLRKRLADLAGAADGNVAVDELDDEQVTQRVHQFQLSETQRTKISRLAASYGKLFTSSDESSRRVERLRQRIASCEETLQSATATDDSSSLACLMDQVESPAKLIRAHNEAIADRDRQLARCESLRERLGTKLSLKQLVELRLPDSGLLAQAAEMIERCEAELQLARRHLADLRSQLADEKSSLEAAENQTHLYSHAALQEARHQRDALLTRIGQASASDGAVDIGNVLQSVRTADEIVDQIRLHQREVVERESLSAAIRKLTSKSQHGAERIDEHVRGLDEARHCWNAFWIDISVPARSPDAMKDWCDDHEALRAQVESLHDAEANAVEAGRAMEWLTEQLRRATANEPPSADDEVGNADNLMMLHQHAAATLDAQVQRQRKMELLRQQWTGWQAELAEAESSLGEGQRGLQDWQQQWSQATESLTAASPTPDDVLPVLDAIKDLRNLMKDRDDMMHRRSSIECESSAYLVALARLISSVDGSDAALPVQATDGEGVDTHVLLNRAAPLLSTLHERAQQAVMDATNRDRLGTEIKQVEGELEQERSRLQRQQVLMTGLCCEAACDDVLQLPAIEARARERQRWSEVVRSTEVDLSRLAAGGSMQAFIDAIGDMQPAVLQDQLDDLKGERDRLADQIETAQRELGGLGEQLRRIDGGTVASDLLQSMANEIGQISRDVDDYARLKLAGGLLRRAIEHYRSENQEPVLKIAESYFHALTCGRYDALKVDYDDKDIPVLFGVRESGVDVPASGMSKGTADSLYLALRLASLNHRCETAQPMPLIVDDCLQQLDDQRAVAAMQVFAKLSTQTQVILFTHHQHLVDLAEQALPSNAVHVHRLATA